MKNSLKNIRGIVFDLDDTLYPQISYKRSGFRVVSDWVASKFELEPSIILSELEDILTKYGPSYPYMFDRLDDRLGIHKECISEMVRIFIEHEPRISCYAGVTSMLSRLRKKYRLGVLTDGRYIVQRKKISALGLDFMVDEILCSDEIGLEKPAGELFAWFENKFDRIGDHLMYVGDNPLKDFYGANPRKWTTVMVGTGESSSETSNPAYKAQYEINLITGLEKLLVENSKNSKNHQ